MLDLNQLSALVDLTSLNSFTVKVILYLQELTLQHVKAETSDGFQFFSLPFLSLFTIQLENVTGTIETVHFFARHIFHR